MYSHTWQKPLKIKPLWHLILLNYNAVGEHKTWDILKKDDISVPLLCQKLHTQRDWVPTIYVIDLLHAVNLLTLSGMTYLLYKSEETPK